MDKILKKGNIHMYYKSLIETLKEDDTNNRIIVNNQVSNGNTVFIDATLNPKDISTKFFY